MHVRILYEYIYKLYTYRSYEHQVHYCSATTCYLPVADVSFYSRRVFSGTASAQFTALREIVVTEKRVGVVSDVGGQPPSPFVSLQSEADRTFIIASEYFHRFEHSEGIQNCFLLCALLSHWIDGWGCCRIIVQREMKSSWGYCYRMYQRKKIFHYLLGSVFVPVWKWITQSGRGMRKWNELERVLAILEAIE